MSEAERKQTDVHKREHPHLNFFNYDTQLAVNSDWCPISTVNCPSEFRRPDIILDINTNEQYNFIKSLYESLYPDNNEFDIIEIVNWYDNEYKRTS